MDASGWGAALKTFLLALLAGSGLLFAQTPSLTVEHYLICDTLGVSPFQGQPFELKLGWVQFEQKTGERIPTEGRLLFHTWMPGEQYEDFEGSQNPVPPLRDPWGRNLFEGELNGLSWQGTTANGDTWELCLVEADTAGHNRNPHFPRYEVLKNGELQTSFVAAESTRPAIAAAWTRGDSCVIIYRYSDYIATETRPAPVHHTVLLNGRNLNDELGVDQLTSLCYFHDELFYLFTRDGKWGWSFAGEETLSDYDELFFDQCCVPGIWNPYIERDGFELITRRDSNWYLVVGTIHSDNP